MTSKLEVEFAYDIGQIVYLRTSIEDMSNGCGNCRSMIIQELIVNCCCGGPQLFYAVSSGGPAVQVPESALMRSSDAAEAIADIWDLVEERNAKQKQQWNDANIKVKKGE